MAILEGYVAVFEVILEYGAVYGPRTEFDMLRCLMPSVTQDRRTHARLRQTMSHQNPHYMNLPTT